LNIFSVRLQLPKTHSARWKPFFFSSPSLKKIKRKGEVRKTQNCQVFVSVYENLHKLVMNKLNKFSFSKFEIMNSVLHHIIATFFTVDLGPSPARFYLNGFRLVSPIPGKQKIAPVPFIFRFFFFFLSFNFPASKAAFSCHRYGKNPATSHPSDWNMQNCTSQL